MPGTSRPLSPGQLSPDRIRVAGRETALTVHPLEHYLARKPEARPRGDWRGYTAAWEIHGGQLRLLKVELDARGPASCRREVTREIFPGCESVVADWYTGALSLPEGERVPHAHVGCDPAYERYTVYVIQKGALKDQRSYSLADYQAYCRTQFEHFKATRTYLNAYEDARKEASDELFIEDFLFHYFADQYLALESRET